ncbi:TetR/AcrR family transcriptional regulator [Ruania zhangjianzhongii]|uniref:TetR/AcrR family transcriptional regulator n=1 Tax=Ruania zhangjianzhongii TaxID=2603206 RepID=UPI0011C7AFEB|nr:TetR family transcriptional regulator [Ruania zhangjianzhongii]
MPISDPSGPSRPEVASAIGRRRPRLTDEQTEQRMLATAAQALSREGLTVSLDHIRLEDVIREAGVSRSTAYRRWPNKDLFLGDLLLELARASEPMAMTGTQEASAAIRAVILAHLDLLPSRQGRLQLAAEVLREVGVADFRRVIGTPQWRTYLALTVSAVSMAEGPLRHQVVETLAGSERAFIQGIVRSHRIGHRLLGLRIRPETGLDYTAFAQFVNAAMRGLVSQTMVRPGLADDEFDGEIFGVQGQWSLPSLVSVAGLSFLEPDPDITWDEGRIEALRVRLEAGDNFLENES